MQLHGLIGTDAPRTPRGRDGRHQTHNTTRVPNPCAQSAVAKLSRRGGGKAAGTHGEPRFGGIARALGAGARVTGTNGTSAPSAGKHPRGAWNTRDGAGRARTTQGGARLGRLARTFGASARFATACLVAGCLALGLASPEAAAQTVKLVSNSSATASGSGARVGPYLGNQFSAAQEFTTGANAAGYTLASIAIDVQRGEGLRPSMSLYDEASGEPGSLLASLSGPSSMQSGFNTFVAPSATVITPSTTYFVIMEGVGGSAILERAGAGNEDTDSATGWTIADSRLTRNQDTAAWEDANEPLRITVRGTARTDRAPNIEEVVLTSDPGHDDTYGIGDDIEVDVSFDEAVTIATSGGTPDLELNVGGTAKDAQCAAHATALDTVVCTYDVKSGDTADTNGISIGANALTLNGGAITFREGTTAANLAHPALPTNPGHKVNGDPTVPAITALAFTSTPSSATDTYGAGEIIELTLTFSHVVWVTGTPRAQINIGGVYPRLDYHSGSGTTGLRFRHTVTTANSDTDGASVPLNTLAPAGVTSQGLDAIPAGSASIRTSAGIDMRLGSARLGGQSGHKVDGSMSSSAATPNAPTNIAAIADGADEIRITWTPPTWPGTSTITEYQVEWGSSDTGPWTRLVPNPTGTSVDHTGLDAATTYHYRVRAVNSSGAGAWSGTTSATTATDLVCGRTSAIADAIVAATPAATCAKVTATQLSEITSLDASDSAITALATGDFAGLSGLRRLDLSGNQIPTLLRNLFTDLSSLTSLDLSGNDIEGVLTGSFAGLSSVITLDLADNDFNTVSSNILSPLSALKYLDASGGTLARVPDLSGLFSNLALTRLELGANGWSELPEGILTGLANLDTLDLSGNTVDPLPIIVDLERVERAKFKALIAAGAPFAAAVPITVADGTLDGTPATVTVNAGATTSADRTVTPANPRTGAVTVTVGTLPALPSGHSGYVLQASSDLPLTVVGEPAVVTITGETGQIVANAWDRADFTLTRTPAGGAIDVEVEVTESDTFVIGGSLGTQSVSFADGKATATLSLRLIRNPSGDGTITATVQAGADNTVGTPASATVNVVDISPAMDVVFRDDTITVEEGNNVIVHVVGTTAAGVERPSMDHPIGITVSTRKAEATPEDGDYTTISTEFFFAYEDFTRNADGRWVGTITAEITTHDDTEYEGTEEFSAKLEGTAGLTGTVTINGTLAPREDDVAILLTDNDPPSPPTDLTASATSAAAIELSWTAPVLGVDDEFTGYKVEWSATGGDPWTVLAEDTGTTDTSYSHTGLTDETTYFYRVSAINAHGTGAPSALASATTGEDLVCGRTPQVRDWILVYTPVDECADVTAQHLQQIGVGALRGAGGGLAETGLTELKPGDFAGISNLDILFMYDTDLTELPNGVFEGLTSLGSLEISDDVEHVAEGAFDGLSALRLLHLAANQITTLPKGIFNKRTTLTSIDLGINALTSLHPDIFSGLWRIEQIALNDNELTELPDGLLRGLTRLDYLRVQDNPGAPFAFTVELEKVGTSSIKVVVPIGAPFDLSIPVVLTNGEVDGQSTANITVLTGRVESDAVAFTRAAGTTAAITATLGTLPTPPSNHNGYALAASASLPLEVAPQATTPGAPTDLTARPDGPNEIELAWVPPEPDPTAPVTGYRIEVSTDAQTWTDAVTDTASRATKYMHTGRTAGTTYHYRVRAINVAGAGDASNVASAMTTALTGVCERTPAVVIEIERATATDCSLISPYQLAQIDDLDLSDHDPATLANGDFDGLSGLASLDLGQGLTSLPAELLRGLASLDKFTASGGALASVPAGLFAGRTTLTKIDLSDNPLTALPDRIFEGIGRLATLDLTPSGTATTLPLAATLKYVEEGVFRIAVPTGAPYDMRMSIFVLNGARAGNEPFVEIPAGRTQSEPIRIVRNDETWGPVVVRLTSAGPIPALHTGYEFSLAPSNGIQVLAGEGASVFDVKLPITQGPFGIDDDIRIDVLFDKEVTVDTTGGSPTIELDVGGTRKTATYETGSGTPKLEFEYTVRGNDEDTDGVSVPANTLKLNGATVRSGVHNAGIEHDALETVATATVDGIAPTLIAKTVDGALVTLTYDEEVRREGGPNAPLFEYNIDNDPTFTQVCARYYSGATIQLTLCAAATASQRVGLLYQELAQYQSITDLAGNPAPGINTALDNITTATAANITSVEITSDPNDDGRTVDDATYAIGDTVEVTVTFDAAVTVNTGGGTPELELDFGGEPVRAPYTSGTLTELIFSYTVAEGVEDTDGIAIEANKLTLNGAIIASDGKNADLSHVAVLANVAHKVDGVRPMATTAQSAADGTSVSIDFNETIASTLTTGGYTIESRIGTLQSRYLMSSAAANGSNVTVNVQTTIPIPYGESLQAKISADTVTDEAGNTNVEHIVPIADGVTEPAAYLTDVQIAQGDGENGAYATNDVVTITARFNKAVTLTTTGGDPELKIALGGGTRGHRTATTPRDASARHKTLNAEDNHHALRSNPHR